MGDISENATALSNHPVLRGGARIGFAVNGVLHLLIAGLAIAVATGSAGGAKADQAGALATVAGSPAGSVLLVVMTVGLLALAVWHLGEALVPNGDEEDWGQRAKALAQAVVYGAVAFTTGTFALGNGSGTQSRKSTRGFTATLMDQPAGRFLVGAVGLIVIGIGCYYVYKGASQRFTQDLQASPGRTAVTIGTVGHVAKGIALGVVGALFIVAAAQHQPKEAAGMDAALRTLKEQPVGALVLVVVAVGLAAFGLYCFIRARWGKL